MSQSMHSTCSFVKPRADWPWQCIWGRGQRWVTGDWLPTNCGRPIGDLVRSGPTLPHTYAHSTCPLIHIHANTHILYIMYQQSHTNTNKFQRTYSIYLHSHTHPHSSIPIQTLSHSHFHLYTLSYTFVQHQNHRQSSAVWEWAATEIWSLEYQPILSCYTPPHPLPTLTSH